MRAPAWLGGWLAWLVVPMISVAAEPDGIAFFEQKIRPVLVQECYSCHSASAKALKGGLRLDSRAGVLAGGDSGPAVVPGKPQESLLIEAVRHEGLVMPPKGKLPDSVIADFERWVTLGAPDPREGGVSRRQVGMDLEAGRKFWSYRLPTRHEPPRVADAAWPWTDIDRFLRAAQEARGVRPVADADKATLVRRLYYDLVGLPPTLQETDAFVADPSPTAYEALVDRLLGSPQFGERWGRHWLDVVRFGESLTLRGLVFKEAWRYRDYVVDSFNADLPYNRFIQEQVAGDLMPASDLAERRRQLVAVTFLTLGNTNLEEQDKPQLVMDMVDEQLDTLGKAFLAQTVGCARCHDHKFDPIPTRDYYALAGILRNTKALKHANVSKWLERPMPVPPQDEAKLRAYDQAIAALEARIKAARGQAGAGGKGLVARAGAIATTDLPGIVIDDTQAKKVGDWQPSQFSKPYIGEGYIHDMATGKGEKTLTFQPELPAAGPYEVWLAYRPGTNRSKAVPVVILSAEGEKTVEVDMSRPPTIEGQFVSLGRYPFERNGQGYVLISNEGTQGHVVADAVAFIPAKSADAVDSPIASVSPRSGTGRGADPESVRRMQDELKRLKMAAPKREMIMAVEEPSKVEPMRVHIRGSVHTLGEPAPRGFLRVATYGEVPAMPSNESGRRELAAWLASEHNPLTARVLVNRAWHWLFGAGIVRSPDNFGTTGDAPTHPELLDDLAVRFMEEGWSLKWLVRQLVLSRTYRLAARDDPRDRAADPENRLLWRSNRRRLDAECIRDAMLSVSGQLSLEMGGRTFPPDLVADYGYQADSTRRSLYAPVFRNALPELFEVFDFADPSMVVGRRNVSTVAPQALFLMNHPFVLEQSRAAARRLLADNAPDDAARVDRAYRRTLGRPPTPAERRIALGFLEPGGRDGDNAAAARDDSWALFFQALFASAEFRNLN